MCNTSYDQHVLSYGECERSYIILIHFNIYIYIYIYIYILQFLKSPTSTDPVGLKNCKLLCCSLKYRTCGRKINVRDYVCSWTRQHSFSKEMDNRWKRNCLPWFLCDTCNSSFWLCDQFQSLTWPFLLVCSCRLPRSSERWSMSVVCHSPFWTCFDASTEVELPVGDVEIVVAELTAGSSAPWTDPQRIASFKRECGNCGCRLQPTSKGWRYRHARVPHSKRRSGIDIEFFKSHKASCACRR